MGELITNERDPMELLDEIIKQSLRGAQPSGITSLLMGIYNDLQERYIKLPVDADGVPIRPGDVMEFKRGDLQRDGAVVLVGKEFVSFGDAFSYHAEGCRHVQTDTVEDMLLDMLNEADGMGILSDGIGELVDDYAERIRKVVEQ